MANDTDLDEHSAEDIICEVPKGSKSKEWEVGGERQKHDGLVAEL